MGSLMNSEMKEKDEELALFFEMRRREKEQDDLLLLQNSDEFDAPLGSTTGSSPIFSIESTASALKIGTDDILNLENDKNDYEWLISPPETPLFPSLELESEETVASQLGTPETCTPVQKSQLSNAYSEPTRSNLTSREPTSSPRLNISSTVRQRPLSSGGSKPSTPNGRPTVSKSKSTLTSLSKPTSNAALKGTSTGVASKISTTTASRSSRSATNTSLATSHSTKPTVLQRSSTPNSRSTIRSSTKSTSRDAAPTLKPKTLSTASNTLPSPGRSPSSSLLIKSTNATRNPPNPHASSPNVKPRPLNSSASLHMSVDASSYSMTSLPDKPAPATRGRPGTHMSSVESVVSGRVRRQSCSPSRGRPPNGGIHSSGSSVPVSTMSRLNAKANTNISPALVGTKMVERVISMRKLAPPDQDNRHSPNGYISAKSSSPENLGFGRTLSKKSLDMAMRHMDIRRSVPSNLQPSMTKTSASSMNTVRSGIPRSKAGSVTKNSPHIDGHNVEYDIISEKGTQSPANVNDG